MEDGVELGSQVALDLQGNRRLAFSMHLCHWRWPVPTSTSAL